MTGPKIVIDANVLVALVDTKDKWHHQAVELRDALVGIGHILSFDKDFDHISFLSRLAVPGDVASLS